MVSNYINCLLLLTIFVYVFIYLVFIYSLFRYSFTYLFIYLGLYLVIYVLIYVIIFFFTVWLGHQAQLVKEVLDTKIVETSLDQLVHFVSAAPGSTNIIAMLRRLCNELERRLSSTTSPTDMPTDYK